MKMLIHTPEIKYSSLKGTYLKGWLIHQISKLAHRLCLNSGTDFNCQMSFDFYHDIMTNAKNKVAGIMCINAIAFSRTLAAI
jgi:hypothetical protein